MNKDNKRLIIIGGIAIAVIIIIVLIFVIVGNSNNNKPTPSASAPTPSASGPANTSDTTNVSISNGDKINTSKKLLEEKTYRGMKISDIKLVASEGKTDFSITITNTSGSDINGHPVTVTFTDNSGNKIYSVDGYVGKVNNGGTTKFSATVTSDLANAYNFTIEAK